MKPLFVTFSFFWNQTGLCCLYLFAVWHSLNFTHSSEWLPSIFRKSQEHLEYSTKIEENQFFEQSIRRIFHFFHHHKEVKTVPSSPLCCAMIYFRSSFKKRPECLCVYETRAETTKEPTTNAAQNKSRIHALIITLLQEAFQKLQTS